MQAELLLDITPAYQWQGPPEKPKYGQACNGCGMCCLAEQCAVSMAFYGPKPTCPALMLKDDRLVCGLVTDPEAHFPEQYFDEEAAARFYPLEKDILFYPWLKRVLGMGAGCDSEFEDEVAA